MDIGLTEHTALVGIEINFQNLIETWYVFFILNWTETWLNSDAFSFFFFLLFPSLKDASSRAAAGFLNSAS